MSQKNPQPERQHPTPKRPGGSLWLGSGGQRIVLAAAVAAPTAAALVNAAVRCPYHW